MATPHRALSPGNRGTAQALLPAPSSQAAGEDVLQHAPLLQRSTRSIASSWLPGAPQDSQLEAVQRQRDGLIRMRERMLATIRDLEAENHALRSRLIEQQQSPLPEQRHAETQEAREIERELDLRFRSMPDDVYPGRPYVTQQELIDRGITTYTRQNISRLARADAAIPAVLIADRVLLPPSGVRALVERERAASLDPSPRRRPRGATRRTAAAD